MFREHCSSLQSEKYDIVHWIFSPWWSEMQCSWNVGINNGSRHEALL